MMADYGEYQEIWLSRWWSRWWDSWMVTIENNYLKINEYIRCSTIKSVICIFKKIVSIVNFIKNK